MTPERIASTDDAAALLDPSETLKFVRLREAFADLDLEPRETRLLAWLASWDDLTVATLIGLVARLRPRGRG